MTVTERRPSGFVRPSGRLRLAVGGIAALLAAETLVGGLVLAAAAPQAPVRPSTIAASTGTSGRDVPGLAPAAGGADAASVGLVGDANPAIAIGDIGPEVGSAAVVPAVAPTGPVEPTIQYEDAQAHANDPNTFAPGGAVTVPFTPRANDAWPVGGDRPVRLPAGRATGAQMAATREGVVWADLGTNRSTSPANNPAIDGSESVGGGSAEATADAASAVVPATPQAPAPDAVSGLRRQVFGFLPYWELGGSTTVLNYGLLSTIAYFSVGADSAGNLKKKNANGTTTTGWGGWTSANMTKVINAAHSAGTRVVLTVSVFAWSTTQANVQRAILGSATNRLRLANQIAAAVRDRGADGVNLDFEPIASGYGDEFTAFVRTLRSQLDAIRKGYQLTFDTTGYVGSYQPAKLLAPGGADALFLMGYDFRTSGSNPVGSIAPLAGSVYDINDALKAFLAQAPASKIILGVPYYGRAWSTTTSTLHGKNQSGTKYGASVASNYENAVDLLAQYGRHYDAVEQVAWTAYKKQNCSTAYGCVTTWRQLYVDDAQALRAKYDLANRYHLRGVGMWALGYDGTRPELYRALNDKFLHDTTVPEAGITALPSTAVDEGMVVSWTGKDDVGVTAYDVQVSTDGGAWTAWKTATTATSDVWLGSDAHTYAFRVRARDTSGNWSPWNVTQTGAGAPTLARGSFGVVVADSLSIRAAPDTSAAKLDTAMSGQVYAITGGPVSANGYTWYEVMGPISSWGPTGYVRVGSWVAAKSATETFLQARRAPNATAIDAGLKGFAFGGATSLGSTTAAVGARSFSPNGDGSRDGLTVSWANTVAFDSLELRIVSLDGHLIAKKSLSAVGVGAQTTTWDGTANGSRLGDGRYLVQLVGVRNGVQYTAPSARPVTATQVSRFAVTIDTVAPTLTSSSVTYHVVSPNGDGRRDATTATATTAGGVTHWRITVTPTNSVTPIRTMSGTGPTPKATWDGRTDAGSVAADGRYTLGIAAFDAAGNAALAGIPLVVDTRPATVTQSGAAGLSPNGDGAADSATLAWASDEAITGIVSIKHGTTLVRSWSFSSRSAWATTWTGRNSGGALVADGTYSVVVSGRDLAGNLRTVARSVVVDRTASFLRWAPGRFYPQDGDRIAPQSRISFRLARPAVVTLSIADAAGHVVRSVWTNRRLAAGSFGWTWDGRRADGTFVPPGIYRAQLTATSSVGTSVTTRIIEAGPFVIRPSAAATHAGSSLTISIWSSEPLNGVPTVAFNQPGRATVTKRATVRPGGLFVATFVVATAPGTATITVRATDAGGGTNIGHASIAVS